MWCEGEEEREMEMEMERRNSRLLGVKLMYSVGSVVLLWLGELKWRERDKGCCGCCWLLFLCWERSEEREMLVAKGE